MKRRNLWILLAALAVVGIVVLALLGLLGGKEEAKAVEGEPEAEAEQATVTPEPTPVDPELPMDETPLTPVEEGSAEEPGQSGGAGETPAPGDESPIETPQPEDGGLDEDELPILP